MPEDNVPPKAGIFGWFKNEANVPASAISDEPLAQSVKAARASEEFVRRNSSAQRRKDSSSLTHDEALNISRANSSRDRSNDQSGSPLSPKLNPQPGGRARSNSRFDKLGLMAAYSAGPSSF